VVRDIFVGWVGKKKKIMKKSIHISSSCQWRIWGLSSDKSGIQEAIGLF
jgi:hypothetical protein